MTEEMKPTSEATNAGSVRVDAGVGRLLPCPVCGGKAAYCDDGPTNQRVDCCGDGKTEMDGCGLNVWLKKNRAEARVVWNSIPRRG